ncbi:MAG TPA: AsnC family transcriptional regulator [Peptococcaceae bacterium]|nr:MAG: Transcriptional regulator, AsnC family [Clostridia bacterium 41_269]HBT20001.1 AsnC family transcriptional regulator [Peptococcaceae bacterium]
MRKEILELLETDSKLTPYQIATMLGIDKSKVEKEIEAMEEEGIILQYSTLINWEKAGVEQVSALIDVKVTPQRGVGFDDIAERIYRFPEVRSVMLMSGSYDLSVEVTGRNIKEVAQFVSQKLATLEHVQSTMTHFVLKRYKQQGVILENKEKDRRQVISP